MYGNDDSSAGKRTPKDSTRKGTAQQIENSPTGYGFVPGDPQKTVKRKGSVL